MKTIFPALLTLFFITLKLTGLIKWNWFWVFTPIWLPIVLFLIFFITIILFAKRRR